MDSLGSSSLERRAPMRGLTFIAPMGQAVVARLDNTRGGVADHPLRKSIDNRPKPLPKKMRGQSTIVAVHCGLKWDVNYAKTCRNILGDDLDYDRAANEGGKIIGLMRLSGRQFVEAPFEPVEWALFAGVNPWYGGPFGYEISEAVAFQEPILCRGNRGWWPVPADVLDQVHAEMGHVAPHWAGFLWRLPGLGTS